VAGFCGFDVETVVADESEDFAVAINTIVAEHLFDGYFACISALIGNVLHEISITSHCLSV
jgi:hypothetical protein